GEAHSSAALAARATDSPIERWRRTAASSTMVRRLRRRTARHSGELKTGLRFNATLPRWDRLHSPHARALTFDMRGGWRQAKLAGRRPLDGRVRPTFVQNRIGGWAI